MDVLVAVGLSADARQFTSPDGAKDDLRLVDVTDKSIFVGGRDHVYELAHSLDAKHDISWSAPGQVAEECTMKGRTEPQCHNFIRVVARRRHGLLVCGTHAFAPLCRDYEYSKIDREYRTKREFNGKAITPYDPRANFTYVYDFDSNEIFVATVSDFNGNDPLIYKKKVPAGDGLRTQKDDLRVLDHPEFVGSFVHRDYVYVWFRERTTESNEKVFSRVGRLCKNDRGGPGMAQDRWSSFLKARLNCSVPADSPFYFNELQSVSKPVPLENGDAIVYAVFATSRSAVLMNAVCAFRMSDIDAVFNQGRFKTQRSVSSYTSRHHVNGPAERPGRCVEDSRKLSDISFILKNPLINDLISTASEPVLVEGPSKPDLTSITVVPASAAISAGRSNQSFNVVYVGRSDGTLLKAVQLPDGHTALISNVKIFEASPLGSINAVVQLPQTQSLVVVSKDRVRRVPMHHCDKQVSCGQCVGLRDPHCAWDTVNLHCAHSDDWSSGSWIQNVVTGRSSQCPEDPIDKDIVINQPLSDASLGFPLSPLSEATVKEGGLSVSTIILFIICAAVLATVLGFLIGYRISKWHLITELQAGHSSGSSSNGSDYDSYGRARLTRHDSLTATSKLVPNFYPIQHKMSDAVSLVYGAQHAIPVMSSSMSAAGSGYTTPHHRLDHAAAMLINNGSMGGGSAGGSSIASHAPSCTLPRDYKVKKVYL
uniref:Sema domain-containing protein n=1 Tax=Panagrellus redivivus TaxID=6233 RepID=A0A7E4W4D6_PANRE